MAVGPYAVYRKEGQRQQETGRRGRPGLEERSEAFDRSTTSDEPHAVRLDRDSNEQKPKASSEHRQSELHCLGLPSCALVKSYPVLPSNRAEYHGLQVGWITRCPVSGSHGWT